MLFVVVVLLGTGGLLALDRFRMDLIGFCALTLLLVTGVLSVPEALAGFGDPTVHMIAGLFVVGGAVFETGLADRFGQSLEKVGAGNPKKLLLTILLATSLLSAFLSSTGTVALMVPVVTSLARRARLSPSKVMIPLAYATLLGGLLTLIATAPNMIVSNALDKAGFAPFGFFDFTGPGLCLLGLGIAFLLAYGDRLLPTRIAAGGASPHPGPQELWERYGLEGWISELRVLPRSPLAGHSIASSRVRTRFGVSIFAIRPQPSARGGVPPMERAQAEQVLEVGQTVFVKGPPEAIARFCEESRLEELEHSRELPPVLATAELLVAPRSSLVGRTVADSRLRSRFDVTVMAVFRSQQVLRESVANTTLQVGDLLLLLGTGRALMKLRDELSGAVVFADPDALKRATFRTEKIPATLAVLGAMLLSMTLDVMPPVVIVICTALALVLLGCIDARTAERTINWESILLIATVLPLATAMVKVGVIGVVVEGLVGALGSTGPYVILSALFFLTATIGLAISNTATALLVSPVAVELAARLDLQPHTFLMTVAVASSSAFLTPVSSPVNMLVVNAGGYKFSDFTKIGLPLLLVIWLGSLIVVPFFFPLTR